MSNSQQRKSSKTTTKTRTTEKDTEIFVPPSNTLSSLKANKKKQYSFSLPKNSCWTAEESPIDGELGDRKFVAVDSTRCLLVHKERTEAILLRNNQTQIIHICSFTPPGDNHDGVPLFEWGVIRRTKGRKNGYTMTTPYDGSYSVRCVTTTTAREINNRTMVVTSSNNDNKICATFEETENTWECRTLCGIDPAMMVCFVVALDTLRTIQSHRSGSIVRLGSIGRASMNNSASNNNKRGSLKLAKSMSGSSSTKSMGYMRGSLGSLSARMRTSSESLPPITSFINARAA